MPQSMNPWHPSLNLKLGKRLGSPAQGCSKSATGSAFWQVRSTILAHPDRVLFGTDIQIGPGMLVSGAGPARGHSRADVDHFFSSSWEFFETSHRAFRHPTPIQGDWSIDGIDLPLELLENIYHKNAERLLGLSSIAAVGERRD